jgi:anaerobic selenocysteine-containing dehydrogenase
VVSAAARATHDGDDIRIRNHRGAFDATARVTDRIGRGTVWMRDGWTGLNTLTSGAPVVPAQALGLFPFTVGQSSFEAQVEVSAA